LNSHQNPHLRHNKALYEQRLILGIPSKVFLIAVTVVLFSFFSAGFLAAVIFFVITIPPLFLIFKEDDQALVFLLDKWQRPDLYAAGDVDDRVFKVLKEKRSGIEVCSLLDIR